jgi:hypothetical protein
MHLRCRLIPRNCFRNKASTSPKPSPGRTKNPPVSFLLLMPGNWLPTPQHFADQVDIEAHNLLRLAQPLFSSSDNANAEAKTNAPNPDARVWDYLLKHLKQAAHCSVSKLWIDLLLQWGIPPIAVLIAAVLLVCTVIDQTNSQKSRKSTADPVANLLVAYSTTAEKFPPHTMRADIRQAKNTLGFIHHYLWNQPRFVLNPAPLGKALRTNYPSDESHHCAIALALRRIHPADFAANCSLPALLFTTCHILSYTNACPPTPDIWHFRSPHRDALPDWPRRPRVFSEPSNRQTTFTKPATVGHRIGPGADS